MVQTNNGRCVVRRFASRKLARCKLVFRFPCLRTGGSFWVSHMDHMLSLLSLQTCLPIPLHTWHWKVFDRDWLQLPLDFACTHGRSRRTLDDPIRFVNYRTFFPKWLACASTGALDIQTRETDSASVCSGEGNHKMLLARLPLCLPEEGDAQKGGALAHAMAQALEKTATASPLGLLEEKTCPSSVHGVCGIHG